MLELLCKRMPLEVEEARSFPIELPIDEACPKSERWHHFEFDAPLSDEDLTRLVALAADTAARFNAYAIKTLHVRASPTSPRATISIVLA